jgi:predicted nucleotidyltransferase
MDSADSRALMERATARIVGEIPGVLAVYVFGSLASGQRSPHSDLDLAVLPQHPIDPAKLYGLARALEAELDIDVDLVDLWVASTVLTQQIITTGRLLYCGDSDKVLDFEARSLSEYGHFRERIAPLLDSVRETGRAYAR